MIHARDLTRLVLAALIVRSIEPLIHLAHAAASLLDDIGQHRRAQAASIMHHAGLHEIEIDDE